MRAIFVAFSLVLSACGKSVPKEPEAQKPWAVGQDWEGIAQLCMSSRPDRLEGCKALVRDHSSKGIGECHTYAFYELRTPEWDNDREAAKEGKIVCESDLGLRPYDGREFVRLTRRATYLEHEISEAKAQRKDAIDDIDIERLEEELTRVRAEKAKMQVAR